MQAIQVQADGSLIYEEVSDPVLEEGSVKIKVNAAGVNRADLLQAQGNYPPPQGSSSILGLEVSGTLEALSEDVTSWEVGDRVMALLPGGGYATQVVVPESLLLPFPEEWDFKQAAAIPEAIYTAYFNLC
jgi:NADPH:quinone reductase-like Zn-dependent oxidoreductase